jgi:polyvinyl alcohol dehydrogenase (cytochrome)
MSSDSMMNHVPFLPWCLFAALLVPGPAHAQLIQAAALYEQRCASCHSAPAADSRAPSVEALRSYSPEAVVTALAAGSMAEIGKSLSETQRRLLADYLTGRPFGAAASGQAAAMKNRCEAGPLGNPLSGAGWNGWGADTSNTRFQPAAAAGLTAAQVPHLQLKWAFGFPEGRSAFGQPTVAGGRVYIGSDNGFLYAVDAQTGCVHWSFQAQAAIRTAPTVAAVGSGGAARYAVYFGDLKANVYAVDAAGGTPIWTKRADTHALARITGAPKWHDGRLYVPVSSLEEATGASPGYECCTFRGSLVVYNAATGDQIWKSYTIPDPPRPVRKTAAGTPLWHAAGAAVWASPTIDAKRRVVYVSTSNAYTFPAAPESNSVIAFDLQTGRRLWVRQFTPDDAFIIGCPNAKNENCPQETGPDFAVGTAPILVTLANGRDVIVVGQKSGLAWGIDPAKDGAVLWQHRVGKGSTLGGIEWGGAIAGGVAFYPNADARYGAEEAGGLGAIDIATGERVWFVKPPRRLCGTAPCVQAQSAAATAIPGVVFSGDTAGTMRAYDARDGRIIWEYQTAKDYDTVNGVPARGGSINGPGPVVVDGMLFMNSGYAYLGLGQPGNVLLAFSVP